MKDWPAWYTRTASVIAIAADDQIHTYHLLKVTSDGSINVKTSSTDSYGTSVQPGTSVFEGYFFECQNIFDRTYKLCAKKKAFVYTICVRYICSDLQEKKKGRSKIYQVTLEEHEGILSSV